MRHLVSHDSYSYIMRPAVVPNSTETCLQKLYTMVLLIYTYFTISFLANKNYKLKVFATNAIINKMKQHRTRVKPLHGMVRRDCTRIASRSLCHVYALHHAFCIDACQNCSDANASRCASLDARRNYALGLRRKRIGN